MRRTAGANAGDRADEDEDDDDPSAPPPPRSQGADYAQLLAEADALYGQAHRRHKALSGSWDEPGGAAGPAAAALLAEEGLAEAGSALLRALGLIPAGPGPGSGAAGEREDASERAASQAASLAERRLLALDAPALAALLAQGIPRAAVLGVGGARGERLGYCDGLGGEEGKAGAAGAVGVKGAAAAAAGAAARPAVAAAPPPPPQPAPAARAAAPAGVEALESEMDALLRPPPRPAAHHQAPPHRAAAAAAQAAASPPPAPPPPAPPPPPPQPKAKPKGDDLTLDEWLDGL